ncbi:hypothetical protein VTL71DRAFT_16172 [Oculimacula yallundae]|uniref:N-acetyltransferase domain-containing protein n=1 Tax=Oculimacula yallundae TaxID=86028 RepID=A0ABR4CFY2_9HELO
MQWLEAQVKEPSEEEKKIYEERWGDVTVDVRMKGLEYEGLDEFGPELERVEKSIMSSGRPRGTFFISMTMFTAVDCMTIHPSHQRKGVASLMLEEALKN